MANANTKKRHGNTNPVRDLGFLEWKNDLSWMEAQDGIRWKRAVHRENEQLVGALKPIKDVVNKFTEDLNESLERSPEPWVFEGWQVVADAFAPCETYSYGVEFKVTAWSADVDKSGRYFAAAAVDPDGYERFSLEVYTFEKGKTPIRISNIRNIGPQVAWLPNTNTNTSTVVFLGAYNDLRYNTVNIWDPLRKEQRVIYTLTDPIESLELGKAEDGSVYVIASDFVKQRLGFVVGSTIQWVAEGHDIIALAHDTWIKDGKTSLGFSENDGYLESISLKGGWAVTRSYGIRTLWKLPREIYENPKAMIFIWGEVTHDTREPNKITISDIRYKPYTVDTENWTLENTVAHPYPCTYYNTVATVFVVNPDENSKPTGLLIAGYGAYGIKTKVGSFINRWLPLLKSGWAIASMAIPGSGDHDISWKTAGQGAKRADSYKVFADGVRDLQEELGIAPEATAIYGRSAGGLLVISVAVNNPGLVGALYVESPYVDILRSISNPKLPLTLIETREFGIGTNPTDIIATGAWSPMERIPTKGIPDIFVVARSDLADLEVFPYEVLKFITRIRGEGGGNQKLLYMSENLGHFTTSAKTRAEDLAALDGWLENNLSNSYNTMYGMMRKDKKNHKNKSRKDKKNHKNKSRKNRK